MRSEKGSTGVWVAIIILLLVLLCLCLAAVLCGAGVYFLDKNSEEFQNGVDWSLELDEYGGYGEQETPSISPTLPPEPIPVNASAEEMLSILSDMTIPEADPIALAERFYDLEGIPTVLAQSAEPVPVGTVDSFWISDLDTDENFRINAELVYAREHIYFWVEEGVDYKQAEVQALVDEFEEKIYPTVRQFFGSEWSPGIDGDQHLYILYATGLGWSVAGYYASIDEYASSVHEYSNGHEMFYLSADNVDLDEEFTYGVLAHEFQHMIHWYRDANEDTWVNEGFSELSSFLNDYDVGGFDFLYVSSPDIPLEYWPGEPGAAGGHYGQAFLVMNYFLDRFGSEATIAVVNHPDKGISAINDVLQQLGEVDSSTGQVVQFDDFYRDFAAAILLQDTDVGDGRYGYHNYPASPSVYPDDEISECPVEGLARDVYQYGIDYIRISCEGPVDLHFTGSTLSKVIPAEVYSGDYAFWSNRGDASDPVLERAFDLREVSGSVLLEFETWYDLEESYDYLYLLVSEDGGENWSILTTPSGTDLDPSGNSYGWAYNGYSGGGQQPVWIREEINLSQYAGEEILLRFEYITDAAVNGEGFLLDDVRIDAVDYFTDFEEDNGGWQADGFVRLYNQVPQTYRVLAVQNDLDVQIHEMTLDENQQGTLSLDLGRMEDTVLIVIGTARFSIQPSAYEISVTTR
ncbi:MAG: immune inhibitor A [Anaerolineales bacterium]|nr:immune inhibitor A [Anaerolineales bacterium]